MVQQEGRTIGKRAPWSLSISPLRGLALQFHIGIQGGEVELLNVKEGEASTVADNPGT